MEGKKKPRVEPQVDSEILDAISRRISVNADEQEIRWWLSIIPDAKSYILRKIKKVNRRINNIETDLEILEEQINDKYLYKPNEETTGMGVTEKKGFAKNRYVRSKQYIEFQKELNQLTELVEGYNIDLENLNEKSLSIRKMASFELEHIYYD